LLALSVVYAHLRLVDSMLFIQAGVAVIVFYMISGFYMTMIITEKYALFGPRWQQQFLISRALRIYPCYWAVLILAIVTHHLIHEPTVFSDALGLNWLQRVLAIGSNILIFGQDWIIAGASLKWNSGSTGLDISWNQFPVLVAWTLAVELTFYVFTAFFIMRDKRMAIFALALAVYLRLYFVFVNGKALGFSTYGIGLSNDPWGYHFFGTVLIFFMIGYLAYQLYAAIRKHVEQNPRAVRFVFAATALLVVAIVLQLYYLNSYRNILGYNDTVVWVAVATFALLIPNLFFVTKNSRVDYYLGFYCYPVYLSHIPAYDIGSHLFGGYAHPKWWEFGTVLVLSAVIVHVVEIPVERIRKYLGRPKPGHEAESKAVFESVKAGT
jgi:peptidoglycan/LPS O-acetylase OafA/YrhL